MWFKTFAERVKEVVDPIIRASLERHFANLYRITSEQIATVLATQSAEFNKKHGNIIGLEVDGFHRGYVVVMTKINGQDIVRVVPIDRDVDVKAYNHLVHWAQVYLGYSIDFTDIPVQLVQENLNNLGNSGH
jgi:hypothetical protein